MFLWKLIWQDWAFKLIFYNKHSKKLYSFRKIYYKKKCIYIYTIHALTFNFAILKICYSYQNLKEKIKQF